LVRSTGYLRPRDCILEKPECLRSRLANAPVTPLPFSEQGDVQRPNRCATASVDETHTSYFGDSRRSSSGTVAFGVGQHTRSGLRRSEQLRWLLLASEPGVARSSGVWHSATRPNSHLRHRASSPQRSQSRGRRRRCGVDSSIWEQHAEHMPTLENYHVAIDIDAPDKNALAKASAQRRRSRSLHVVVDTVPENSAPPRVRRQQREHRLATVRKALAAIGVQLQAPLTSSRPASSIDVQLRRSGQSKGGVWRPRLPQPHE